MIDQQTGRMSDMLKIYGASDDLVEIEGIVSEELGAYDKPRVVTVGDRETGGCVVVAEYAVENRAGVWSMSVSQIDEDVPIPWPVSIAVEHGYSVAVVIDCPSGTKVRFA
jgi:hypothetical protein